MNKKEKTNIRCNAPRAALLGSMKRWLKKVGRSYYHHYPHGVIRLEGHAGFLIFFWLKLKYSLFGAHVLSMPSTISNWEKLTCGGGGG